MKSKTQKLIALGVVSSAVAAMALTGCQSNTQTTTTAAALETTQAAETTTKASASEYEIANYVGHKFTGTDPWGGELTIVIKEIEDDVMSVGFKDVIEDLTFDLDSPYVPIFDGSIPFSPNGFAEGRDDVIINYITSLELKDGNLEMTYESGEITTTSEQGGSSAYNAEALEEDQKTVILTDAGEAEAELLAGGWEFTPKTGSLLTDDEQDVWQKLNEDWLEDYEPVSVLYKQVVAGTNYVFLTQDESDNAWMICTIYEDLEGNVELLSTLQIDPADFHTVDPSSEMLAGAFECAAPEVDSNVLPEAAADADVSLTPIQMLGTQVVAGTNYAWLCRGVDADGNANVYAVIFYEDPEGKTTLSSCECLDIGYYTATGLSDDSE
jgi:hypothetical protein